MFEPTKNYVLIDPDGKKTDRESGIVTNISIEGSMRRGTVLAVGPKVKEVKPKDRVAYQVFEGKEINGLSLGLDNKNYALLYEGEILGIIEEE